jgi:hypothetical protein
MRRDSSFERFVNEEWLGEYSGIDEGGLWRTWCCDEEGESLGFVPLYFESLPRAWRAFCACIGLEYRPLPRLNEAAEENPEWTSELIEGVAALCRLDLQCFGYSIPL